MFVQAYGNPNWGSTNFDMFHYALLSMFQVISLEGWSLLMSYVKDAEGAQSDAYFMTLVVIGTYFLMNVFIAGISGVFLRVRAEHQMLLKRKRLPNKTTFYSTTVMANVLRDDIMKEDARKSWYLRLLYKSRKMKRNIIGAVQRTQTHMRAALSFKFTSTMEGALGNRRFSRAYSRIIFRSARAAATVSENARSIVEHPHFDHGVLLLVTVNIVVLCMYRDGLSKDLLDSFRSIQALLLVLFTVEMFLRFFAYGPSEFVADRMNVFDVFIIAISTAAVISLRYPNLSSARVLRWFYLSKKHVQKNPSTVATCIKSTGSMVSVFFFYVLVITVYSIISMELYSGQYYNFPDGYPRANHDSMLNTMLLWFTVTTGESWVNQMWNSMRPGVKYNWLAPFLYILYYCMTTYVILNLIIAVILEESELTDNQKKHIQRVEHMKLIRRMQSRQFVRSGSWVVGAVEGAHAGLKRLASHLARINSRSGEIERRRSRRKSRKSLRDSTTGLPVRYSSSSLPRNLSSGHPETRISGVLRNPSSETRISGILRNPSPELRVSGILRNSSSSLPRNVGTGLSSSRNSSARNVRIYGLPALSSVATRASLSTPGDATSIEQRPSRRRTSKVLQISGFTEEIIGNERKISRTVLENAVRTVADVTSPPRFARLSPARLSRGLSRLYSRYNVKRSMSKQKSFHLSEFVELERSTAGVERPWYLSEGSLLIFGSDNVVRKFCKSILDSRWYWWYTMFWISISIWTVIEMKPTGKPLILNSILPVFNVIVLVVFLIDMILKVVAQGLILAPDAYISDIFSVIDIMVLLVDILNLVTWPHERSERCIHSLLAMRPFRFMCRLPGLRILFINLLATLPAVMSVLLFSFAIFAIFSSIGVQVFRGLLKSCNDPNIGHRAGCVGSFVNSNSLLVPRTWTNPPFHFDDFGSALLTLFISSTFDNWVGNWLYPVMDISGYDKQPNRNQNPAHALFMVAFICAGGFFIVRVFIGVFINEFGVRSGSKLLTERQKLWRDMNRIVQKMKPIRITRPPRNRLRKFCHFVVHHKHYSPVMVFAIICYCIFLATRVGYSSKKTTNDRQVAHAVITAFFVLEMLAKMLGNEVAVYLQDRAALMEAVITLFAATCLMAKSGTARSTIGRLGYTSRIFCLIPHIPRARLLVNTVIVSLPIVAEIMALLMMCLFSFAGVGFQLFTNIKDGVCIGPWINFRSFVNSFITVFQITTADNWSCIMADAMITAPICTLGTTFLSGDCGYPIAAIIYFVLLIVLANYIFMNLFVAIILDAITFGLVNENSMITTKHLDGYRNLWAAPQYDSRGTGFIGIHKLRSFVNALGVPLGRRHKATTEWYARIEYEVLSFRVPGKGIPFKQLLETLTLYKIGPTGLPLSLRIEREKQIQAIYRRGAATKIQAIVRGFLVRKNAKAPKDIQPEVFPTSP